MLKEQLKEEIKGAKKEECNRDGIYEIEYKNGTTLFVNMAEVEGTEKIKTTGIKSIRYQNDSVEATENY